MTAWLAAGSSAGSHCCRCAALPTRRVVVLQKVAVGRVLELEASRVGRGRLQLCIRLGWRLCAAALTGSVQAVVWPRGVFV